MTDPQDDAVILAIGRALQQRGGVLQFDEAQAVDEGFKVTATLTASATVALQQEIAHGRRQALEILIERPR